MATVVYVFKHIVWVGNVWYFYCVKNIKMHFSCSYKDLYKFERLGGLRTHKKIAPWKQISVFIVWKHRKISRMKQKQDFEI
jgi:hypothetical protein